MRLMNIIRRVVSKYLPVIMYAGTMASIIALIGVATPSSTTKLIVMGIMSFLSAAITAYMLVAIFMSGRT